MFLLPGGVLIKQQCIYYIDNPHTYRTVVWLVSVEYDNNAVSPVAYALQITPSGFGPITLSRSLTMLSPSNVWV